MHDSSWYTINKTKKPRIGQHRYSLRFFVQVGHETTYKCYIEYSICELEFEILSSIQTDLQTNQVNLEKAKH